MLAHPEEGCFGAVHSLSQTGQHLREPFYLWATIYVFLPSNENQLAQTQVPGLVLLRGQPQSWWQLLRWYHHR